MTLKFKGNSRVVYTVQSYDICLEFYKNILPLEIVNEWNRSEIDRGIVYQLGQIELELLKGNKDPTPDPSTYIYVQVENVDAVYDAVKNHVEITTPITDQTWNHRNFTFKDPAGIHLKFFNLIKS